MAEWGPNMTGYGSNMFDIRKQSSDLWTNMLKQAQGLQSGSINPWDLPEFKQYQQLYQNQMDKFGKNLYANASSRGMNPGALMNQFGEQGIKGQNEAMMQMFQQAMSRVPQYATQGNNMWNQFADMWEKHAKRSAEDEQQNQMMQQARAFKGPDLLAGLISGIFGGSYNPGDSSGGAGAYTPGTSQGWSQGITGAPGYSLYGN